MEKHSYQRLESFINSNPAINYLFDSLYQTPNSELDNNLNDRGMRKRVFRSRFINQEQTEYKFFGKTNITESVNELLDLYTIIFIGVLTGYFPKDFSSEIRSNIVTFLQKEPIREYYTFKEKRVLPEIISAYCAAINLNLIAPFFKGLDVTENYFNDFLILNYSIENNIYIKGFLNFIEIPNKKHGQTYLIKKIIYPDENVANNSLVDDIYDSIAQGAMEFLTFLIDLNNLINKLSKQPILQSAIWNYYFFLEKINLNITMFYDAFFSELKENLENKSNEENLSSEIKNEMLRVILKNEDLIKELFTKKDYSTVLKNIVQNQLKRQLYEPVLL